MKDNLREAQLIMLDLLIEFDRVCSKYNLVYWLDFGTLLGAVRHKGFIPWDDDLDVAMPRDDYNKFLKIAVKELKSSTFVQTKETDESFFLHFARLRNRKSIYIEKHEEGKEIKYHQGIYIDIFPVNYIKDTKFSKYLYTFLKIFTKSFSNRHIAIDFMSTPLIKLTTLFHNKNNRFIVRGGEMMTNELQINKEEVFPLLKIEFEGYKFNAPKNLHLYLTLFYGDYITLPPINQRKSHHIYIATKEVCSYERNHLDKSLK